MAYKRDTRTIERDAERSREKLSSAFDSLFSQSTVDLLAREALNLVRSRGYRQTAEQIVRANPLAVAVTGVGLAWLLFGGRSRAADLDDYEEEEDDRWERAREKVRRPLRRARAAFVDEEALVEDAGWADAIDRLRASTSARLRKLEEDARAFRDGLGSDLSDTAASAQDYLSERAELLAELSEGMRARFAQGLDDLTAATRERIIIAREEAYAARVRAEEALGRGGREAKRMVEEHPMVAGAVAVALGAALAAAIRHRRASADTEDDGDDDPDDVEEARAAWRSRKSHRRA